MTDHWWWFWEVQYTSQKKNKTSKKLGPSRNYAKFSSRRLGLIFLLHGVITVLFYTLGAENLKEANFGVIYLAILCDLFGMVKWPPTRVSKGHFESPGREFLSKVGSGLSVPVHAALSNQALGNSNSWDSSVSGEPRLSRWWSHWWKKYAVRHGSQCHHQLPQIPSKYQPHPPFNLILLWMLLPFQKINWGIVKMWRLLCEQILPSAARGRQTKDWFDSRGPTMQNAQAFKNGLAL